MRRYSSRTIVAWSLSICALVIPSGSWAIVASTPIYLNAATAPSSGTAGVSNVNVTGSGFPSGTIPPANVTVSLATACGGGGAVTTPALSVTVILGTSERIQFQIPASLAGGTYFVSISGSTSGGTFFQSVNRPSGPGAGTGQCSALTVTANAPTNTPTNTPANANQHAGANERTDQYTHQHSGGDEHANQHAQPVRRGELRRRVFLHGRLV